MDADELVLSDVHLDKVLPQSSNQLQLSRFSLRFSPSATPTAVVETEDAICLDEDGDLDVARKPGKDRDYDVIHIFHQMKTTLPLVGLQVWRGALLMCDYVMYSVSDFQGKHVLELGCGVGLTGIVLGQFAADVLCTDVSEEILSMCEKNVQENERFLRLKNSVSTEVLDWNNNLNYKKYLSQEIDIIVACDCVYDNDLTDALFRTIYQIMSRSKRSITTYLSQEKRINFTLSELAVTCLEYNHFRRCLREAEESGKMHVEQITAETIPQSFEYVRSEQLELWTIRKKME